MPNFEHYLVTRFNVGLYSGARGEAGDSSSDNWMEHRFKLFDAFCFPSVKNQSNGNFTWLVLFDAETPPKFRNIIAEYHNSFPAFTPVFVDLSYGESAAPSLRRYILERKAKDAGHIITTRLDCDDSLHFSAIDEIQKQFNGQKFKPVNFIHGYFYDLAGDAVYETSYDCNPFISLIEKVRKGGIATIMNRVHGEWHERKSIAKGRLWLQVVHDRNLLNTATGKITGFKIENIENEFGIDGAAAAKIRAEAQAVSAQSGEAPACASSPRRLRLLKRAYTKIFQSRYATAIRVSLRELLNRDS
ncbi:MAG: glycosyltransferase [bacterium]